MSFNVGENIGPYRIVEKLGQGGMATVFKAYHANLDRYVAIKALHPAFNEDQSFAARFQREARVVAKLEHPHIVPIYDYSEHEARPYLVMKFIEGDTLKARMDKGPLSAQEITQIVEAMGSALTYAHKQGILHRDIKPSNVLLANDGQLYLADFGLARMAQAGESTLSSDMIMGTPQYISPEQAMGIRNLDQRTDLYSLGVMLYEMVVGRVPFNADTPFSIIHDHIYTPLPMPHVVNPNVPESVERVLLKSLAKERDDRYEDVLQMTTAFMEAWHEAGVPIQGTFVRVSQAIKPVDQVAAPPPATIKASEGVRVAGTASSSNAKLSLWAWVGITLAIVLCVGLLGFVRSNRLIASFMRSRNNNAPIATTQPLVINNPPLATAQPTPITPPVADADKHLHLALDAWQNKDLRASMDEVQQVVALRPDQNNFLIEAGTELFDAQQYIGAAYIYAHTAQNFKNTQQPLTPEVRDRLEQSFYFAVAMDEFPVYIPADVLKNNDPPLAAFAQSRFAFLHGNMDIAHKNLNDLLHMQPNWPLAQLLNAEILIHDGKAKEARIVLNDLIQSLRTQDWVKEQSGILLNKVP